ncbi:MAG: hypothetical protein SPJ35_00340, partial [Bacteroidaceae bacterium]|nr:hypothetical protein [Bacteroidaceae bacterium]
GKKDCQGVIEQLAHLELTVELVPPYILGTLGNTNHKLFGLVFTGCKQKRHQAHKEREDINRSGSEAHMSRVIKINSVPA